MARIANPSERSKPLTGWTFRVASSFDLTTSPGLIARIAHSSRLKRQAAFVVLAALDQGTPIEILLEQLGERRTNLAEIIETTRARDLVAAAFGSPTAPPSYMAALERIGPEPLAQPHYCRLRQIYSSYDPIERARAHVLRYLDKIDTLSIAVVDILEPEFLMPQFVQTVRHPNRAHEINIGLRLIIDTCSTMTGPVLREAIMSSVRCGRSFNAFLDKTIMEKADRFPPPPIEADEFVRPLTDAQSMHQYGRIMRNCLGRMVKMVVLGLRYYYVVLYPGSAPLIAELSPLDTGEWMLREVHLSQALQLGTDSYVHKTVDHFVSRGIRVGCNPRIHPHAVSLSQMLQIIFTDELAFHAIPPSSSLISEREEIALHQRLDEIADAY